MKKRLLRITTVPVSMHKLLGGQLTYMQQQGFEVLAVSAAGEQVEILASQGVAHKSVLFTRKITPLHDVIALFQLVYIILKFRPDIVHTHTPKAGLLGMLASWLCCVPARLHTVAGLPLMEAKGWKRTLLNFTERLSYRFATAVYPNSQGLYDFIVKEFSTQSPRLSKSKFKIIGKGSSNGIDTNYFQQSDELKGQAKVIRYANGIDQAVIVFIFIGRLVRDKGVHELADAFQQICEEQRKSGRVTARLLLVGNFEDDLDPLDTICKQYLINDVNIILAGYQEDVRPWLAASNVLVLPSYREGFPNVVLQAGAMKLPCIVSDIAGCSDIIAEGINGYRVKAKHTHDLLLAMKKIEADTAMQKLMGEKGREIVMNNFEQQYVWQALLAEYLYVLKN
jgi:glycosyltransferase involved in cell wall biosynthesis